MSNSKEAPKRKYRVREGMTHGKKGEYGPGAVIELTEEEAAGFLDKLEPVEAALTPSPEEETSKPAPAVPKKS